MTSTWVPIDVDDDDPHEARFAGDPAALHDALHELLEAVVRPTWMASGSCARGEASVDTFFPTVGQSNDAARALCAGCSVRSECLQYARDHPEPLHGVWGGLTKAERRALKRSAA